MKKVKLGEVCEILSGYAFKSSQFNDNKIGLPLIRIRDVERGFSDTYFEGTYPEEYLIKNGDLLITMDGSFILKKWEGDLALLNQRVCKIKITDKSVDEGYISWLIPKFLKEIEDKTPFVTVKHLSVAKIKDISFVLPNKLEQKLIAKKLNTISQIYDFRKIQSEKFNELVKSRFNEMFGENKIFESIDNLFDIIDGDRGKNYPKSDELFSEEYCLFLNTKNVTKNGFSFDTKQFITKTKDKLLRKGKLERYDIVLAIIDLLASTGMRVGELVQLNRSDIDFENRECVVFGKGKKERPVYFDARTKIHLRNYLNDRKDSHPALFVTLVGKVQRLGIAGVEIRLRKLGDKLGIQKVHPHKFRRTLATKAIDKGMPIEQVQKLLGHSKIDTTLAYAMVNQNNVKHSHQKFIS
ncbi:type I restriction-modification system subunit S [Streptococcus pneumoniae]|nr:type I restriction-modification system subunit S [Streptococcus pneumoniae]